MSASSASISCCLSGWTAIRKLREADTRDYREKVNRYKATY